MWLTGMFATPNIFGGPLIQNYVMNPLIGDLVRSAFENLLVSPIVIDLGNNGLNLVSWNNNANNVFYDLQGNGFAKDVGWIQPTEAFLVH